MVLWLWFVPERPCENTAGPSSNLGMEVAVSSPCSGEGSEPSFCFGITLVGHVMGSFLHPLSSPAALGDTPIILKPLIPRTSSATKWTYNSFGNSVAAKALS
jgi:hypothetical protein